MTLLSIIQNVSLEVGITKPTTVIGNTDLNIQQLLALANKTGQLLVSQNDWQGLIVEKTHTTLAQENQGVMTTLSDTGFRYIIDNTMWNRTLNRPAPGPLSNTEWQTLKSSSITGPYQEFRLFQGNLYFIPAPSAGDTVVWEYVTKNYILDNDGSTSKATFAEDTDTIRIPEILIELGLVWRWKKTKGLDYAEDQDEFDRELALQVGRDGAKPHLRMDRTETRRPGLLVPDGSWNL
jgi:hypothetical protein